MISVGGGVSSKEDGVASVGAMPSGTVGGFTVSLVAGDGGTGVGSACGAGTPGAASFVFRSMTWNALLLVSVRPEVRTVTDPVVAPLGTVAVMYVSETTVKLAEVPLKATASVAVNPWPSNPIVSPTLAEECGGKNLTKGSKPTFRLYKSPRNLLPPSTLAP